MNLKNLCTLLFLVFISCNVFAQTGWIDGEIALKDGDTQLGMLKIKLVSKDLIALGDDDTVKFKPAKKGKKKKYSQSEIDHIILEGFGYYEYVKVGENRFDLFKVVTTGRAILYHRNVSMTSSSGNANGVVMSSRYFEDEYYVQREDETIASPLITGRISKSFRHRAANYFSDCPKLVAKLENKTYRKRDIEDVVQAYNTCEILK